MSQGDRMDNYREDECNSADSKRLNEREKKLVMDFHFSVFVIVSVVDFTSSIILMFPRHVETNNIKHK